MNDLIILKSAVVYAVASSDSEERQDITSAKTHAHRCRITDLTLVSALQCITNQCSAQEPTAAKWPRGSRANQG